MEIKRLLSLKSELAKKSCFLFGPRQTGKTTLIKEQFPSAPFLQLLDVTMRRELIENPMKLSQMIPSQSTIVIIDEIQKVPELLDIVHLLIEEKKIKFLMTGSSARKIKQTGANLLGGRARSKKFYPLLKQELKEHFQLPKALNFGTLPSIYFSNSPDEDLRDYVSEYLIQEISAEGITRNIPTFSRFLEVAALNNGQILNYAAIGSDAGVKRGTVQNYYEILEDTLIGFRLPPWQKSKTRKAITAEKFYLFDTGIVNSLTGRKNISMKTAEAGFLLETLVLNELRAWNDYQSKNLQINYWKSKSGFEVDFLLNAEIAIEVKCKENVTDKDLRGLKAISEESKIKKAVCVYLGKHRAESNGIELIPFDDFIEILWADDFF